MSAKCNLITALILFFSIVLVGNTTAQDNAMPKPDFGEGAFEDVSAKMEKLLELNWDGNNLTLKRDWEDRLKEKKKEKADEGEDEELDDVVEKLVDHGIPEAQAKQMAKRLLAQGNDNPFGGMRNFGMGGDKNQPAVEKAFFAVAAKFGSHSSGSSGINERRQLNFSTRSLSGVAVMTGDGFKFQFTENQGDERSFELWDDGEGKLKFEFSYGELFVRFLQTKKGKTQLIWIASDKADVYVGNSFSDFVKRNPVVAEKRLLPLFDRLGIKKPIGKTDPEVLTAAINRMQNLAETDTEKLKQLIADLDSDSYQTRKDASEKLNDGFEAWSARIKEFSTDTNLSPEARVRLNEIIDENSESKIAILINDMGLLQSPEFLVAALEFAKDDQKEFVAKQLEKVTDQSHGTSVQAWKDWLKTSDD